MSEKHVYIIETPGLTLKITAVEVDKLYIHEEIIPSVLKWLVDKIKSDGVFKDPIVVDEKTLVVLDGMHRVAAAKQLDFKYIPVCLVDYDSPLIGLYAWGRVFRVKSSAKHIYRTVDDAVNSAVNTITSLGYRITTIQSLEAGFEALDKREIAGLLVTPHGIKGVKHVSKDIKMIYDGLKRIEVALENKGFEVGYYTEKDSVSMVQKGEAVATLIPPVIRKNEVRAVALRGEVFVHKATRHVIPARPLNINVPLEWLSGKYDVNEVKRMIAEYLTTRRIKRLPPGTVLDRRYEEELYVFE